MEVFFARSIDAGSWGGRQDLERAAVGPRVLLAWNQPDTEWEGSEIHAIGVCEPLTKVLLRDLNLSVN